MTRQPFSALLAPTVFLILLWLTSASAGAVQGLAQIRLGGQIAAPSEATATVTDGVFGHLVEIEIEAKTATSKGSAVLHLHVAAGTTGAELLQLVSAKLSAAAVPSTLTMPLSPGGENPKARSASLWVEGATRIHLRLGGGITGSVSCVEGPPKSIRVLPASAIERPTQVRVDASTAIIMNDRAPVRGRATFQAALDKVEHAAGTATALWEAATDKWMSDRPGGDAWRPIKMASGATLTGVSVGLSGVGDWALQVSL